MALQGFEQLWSADRARQNAAFQQFMAATAEPVNWAYEVWDEVVGKLADKDNHNRAIAAQLLCNLAKSDPGKRLLRDFGALFAVTYDERFVTARHCMQSLWKVGALGGEQRAALTSALENRFRDCTSHKNCTLIRYDIVQSLRKVYDVDGDQEVREVSLRLIESEDDLKYRRKYAGLWR